MKYRKKPILIDAYQTDKEMDIETLEGTMHASVGDFIITGVQGERYPCKPDIFTETYEAVLDDGELEKFNADEIRQRTEEGVQKKIELGLTSIVRKIRRSADAGINFCYLATMEDIPEVRQFLADKGFYLKHSPYDGSVKVEW